jgi:hypothetical protein
MSGKVLVGVVLIALVCSCGIRKSKSSIPENMPVSLMEESRVSKASDADSLKPTQVAIGTSDLHEVHSKPLVQLLVIYRIIPTEISNHVPIRTYIQSVGELGAANEFTIAAYPDPSDINDESRPISLSNGYFLDRSGFISAGTRFLDVHYNDYQKLNPKNLTSEWFANHVIPTDAMQFEWLVCDCNKGETSENIELLNAMIKKGLDSFRHPQISTQIHPKYGSKFPQK